jgi:transposase
VIRLGELVMILDSHRQSVSVSAIARQLGLDRKTVRTHIAKIDGAGLQAAATAPDRSVRAYLRERLAAFPTLASRRLWRELAERGDRGGYTAVTDLLRDLRPPRTTGFEVRFETSPGAQAQVDFAQFVSSLRTSPASSGLSGRSRWCSATPS